MKAKSITFMVKHDDGTLFVTKDQMTSMTTLSIPCQDNVKVRRWWYVIVAISARVYVCVCMCVCVKSTLLCVSTEKGAIQKSSTVPCVCPAKRFVRVHQLSWSDS